MRLVRSKLELHTVNIPEESNKCLYQSQQKGDPSVERTEFIFCETMKELTYVDILKWAALIRAAIT